MNVEEKEFYKNLEKGQRFQDYYSFILWHERKRTLCNFQRHDFQKLIGENLQKEEIKYDELSITSKNLFIETEERVSSHQNLKPAGIYAIDNPRSYVVGNYDNVWIFRTEQLKKFHTEEKPDEVPVKNKITGTVTAKGFLLPKKIANNLCYDKIEDLWTKWTELIPSYLAAKFLEL